MSQRLRIINTSFDGRRYTARLEGRRGRSYALVASIPFSIESIEGATIVKRNGSRTELIVPFDAGSGDWMGKHLVIRVGSR